MEDMGIAQMCLFWRRGLNPAPIVEVFEPIELAGDEFAPIDAVVKRRGVVPLVNPLASVVAGQVQWVRLGQVCWERG